MSIVRVILSVALIYGVYTETGIFTAIAFSLVFLAFEAAAILVKRLTRDIMK